MDSPLSAGPYRPIHGAYVRDKTDALILCQAAHDGLVQQASQKISIQQRKQLATSGSLFVFEKSTAEMERWTDGRGWSRSRQLPDKFFVYFEEYTNSNNMNSAGLSNEETTTPKRTKRSDPSDLIGNLVGPLRYLSGFSTQVLIKKTITLKFPGKEWHVVSYFTVDDVLSGKLPAVSDSSLFQGSLSHVAHASHSMGPMIPSPPPSMPPRQGRMRSSTWSNGSEPAAGLMHQQVVQDQHTTHRGLQSRVIAPPRLESHPGYNTMNGIIPVNGNLGSGPTSPVRRTGPSLTPLDTSLPMSPNRRASAPTAPIGFLTHSRGHSGASSPNSATFSYSPMPFQFPTLCTPPFGTIAQHSLGEHGAFPVASRGIPPMTLPSPQQSIAYQSPPSSGRMNMAPWGFPETHAPLSPSACFDFEAYASSLTPDKGSSQSSPTMSDLPVGGSFQGAATSSSTVIDPFLDVGHWGFENDGARDCVHEQITPKAFEHGPISFDGGLMLSNDADVTMDFQMQQWIDTNCHTQWPAHA
ncbi:hypothetical protein DACRYDRAFT_25422 [Dacryopinax primogenitus]|uniref:Gti1/Pac2 family-domain-containing protein n=1 Tax=Dacryopinax primogenitus (strain DJM 731) TaxID=1858805 RepID=M5FQJ1_DACPD|nr:uncharacterized protein DACRYDRAFT_25422 [Dacryopinax primogenitus]EJT97009.1 hypothetical protein DACRYDRAFT_25422 [Dacryopinax primogenitus]